MGSSCLVVNSNKIDPIQSELSLKSKSNFTPEQKTLFSKSIIKIQSHIRRILIFKFLSKNQQKKLISTFNHQIESNSNIIKLTETEYSQAIHPIVKTSMDTFNKETPILISKGVLKPNDIINNNNNNKSLSSSLFTFSINPIKYRDTGEIYKGDMKYNSKDNRFDKCGNATIIKNTGEVVKCNFPNTLSKSNYINANIFYKNGDIFCGTIKNTSPYSTPISGSFLHISKSNKQNHIHSYIGCSYQKADNISANINVIENVHISYANGNVYIGQGTIPSHKQTKIVSEGEGLLKYANDNSTYQGTFKNGKPNGKGTLFIPSNPQDYDSGYGQYVLCTWTNGYKHGNGIIKTKHNDGSEFIENCLFRFDKVIKKYRKAIQSNVNLHINILWFLNDLELSLLSKTFKTKSLLEIKRNIQKRNQMKFSLMMYNGDTHTKMKSIKQCKVNNTLLLNIHNISNIDTIISNNSNANYNFLPFFAYSTNGGIVETRYHYNNIFNPHKLKTYTSHYLLHCDKDINIKGVINYNIYKNNNNTFTLENYKTIYCNSQNIYLPIDKYRNNINDEKIILTDSFIGDISHIKVCVNKINIFIPRLFNIYSLCNSPCNFLAVYLSLTKDCIDKCNVDVNENLIKESSFDIKELYIKHKEMNIPMIMFEEKENFAYIEYDSEYKKKENDECAKLVCVIQIKEFFKGDKDNVDFNIELQKFFHLGKYVNVRLICQKLLPEMDKKICIDFGTIYLYGDVLEFN
jgi:hypothetical protein